MAFNFMHQHQQQQQAPPQQTEFYSGQWTKEEQDYVSCLVDGFKNGSLDIPDGTSLRFFIAAKLGCKPKRVSKKYERSGYNGKQVYRRDTNLPTKDLEDYRERLTNCEKKFKESRALVVSMQEAKTDSRANTMAFTETPVISLTGCAGNSAALEDRLVAMRSQLDRTTNSMLGFAPPPQQQNLYNMMGAGGGAGSGATNMSPDVLQAMMMQRQRAAALGAQGGGSFSTGLPSSGGPTNKLLVDLYQRRQQLIMSCMNGTAGGPANAGMPPAMMGANTGMSPTMMGAFGPAGMGAHGAAMTSLGDKRAYHDDLAEAEEQARKRARAA